MALYAVFDGGQIVGYREINDWENYPQHKKDACDEKGDGNPVLRPVVFVGEGPIQEAHIEADRVEIRCSRVPLADIKNQLKKQIEDDAETCRLRYITPGHGQMMTYMEKHAQAQAVIDLGEAATNALTEIEARTQFPTLAATVGFDAPTLWQVAQVVVARYETFSSLSFFIERTRAEAKAAIDAAETEDAARAAYGAVQWMTP